ncbi:Cytochrome c oxidase assembly factor 1 [Paramyrothecium foliicola]|nr:Cytochrome c oxidase assembly factor 1 [Paramyrothecium foliicola]
MLSRLVRRRLALPLKGRSPAQRRWITPAPKPGDGPLMSRRADRELPDMDQIVFRWRRTFPIFLAIVAACSVGILNYQKSSSPVVAGTLYALRTSPKARAALGDEIYFKGKIPWIRGELNQVAGHIDIHFGVRGTRGAGTMRFASTRPTSRGAYETTEWSLTTDDGKVIDLLEGADPFKNLLNEDATLPSLEDDADTRGFRQQGTYNR